MWTSTLTHTQLAKRKTPTSPRTKLRFIQQQHPSPQKTPKLQHHHQCSLSYRDCNTKLESDADPTKLYRFKPNPTQPNSISHHSTPPMRSALTNYTRNPRLIDCPIHTATEPTAFSLQATSRTPTHAFSLAKKLTTTAAAAVHKKHTQSKANSNRAQAQ